MSPKARLATVSNNVNREENMYCSLCGIQFEKQWQAVPEWLKKITLLALSPDGRIKAVPGRLLESTEPVHTLDYYAWKCMYSREVSTAVPLHQACFLIIKSVLRHRKDIQEPVSLHIASLTDAYSIFMERADETITRLGFSSLRMFEPSNYGVYKEPTANGFWNALSFVFGGEKEMTDCWKSDPLQLSFPNDPRTSPDPDWNSPIPPEIAEIIFKYAYSQPTTLSRRCEYIFPQIWWRRIFQSFEWLKDVKLDMTGVHDWERVVRELLTLNQSPMSPEFSAFRNRKRIWTLACDMQMGDMIDVRTRYCSCIMEGHMCEVWKKEGQHWCRGTWDNVRRENNHPSNWEPVLIPYND